MKGGALGTMTGVFSRVKMVTLDSVVPSRKYPR